MIGATDDDWKGALGRHHRAWKDRAMDPRACRWHLGRVSRRAKVSGFIRAVREAASHPEATVERLLGQRPWPHDRRNRDIRLIFEAYAEWAGINAGFRGES